MNVVPFVHEGLGNSSYLVEASRGEALLIDPDRSFDRYRREAEAREWRIVAVLETHVHADFVTGAVEALDAADATVFQPAAAACEYRHTPVVAGDPFMVACLHVEPIASPGHTPEHISYVVRDASGPPLLFSGGSMIVGGAARTDLISPERTDELTRTQYHTLRESFALLPDETRLLPTHGGGSFCSAGGGHARTSTLGAERAANPALAIEDEEEFVRWFPATFPAAPQYFFRMRAFNQRGPRPTREIAPPPRLPADEFRRLTRDALVVDVRQIDEYARGHIPGSLSIPFRDSYAVWLGWLVDSDRPLLFVLGDEPLASVVDQSLLVGYESFAGVLEGGIAAWEASGGALAHHELVDGRAARRLLADGALAVDVREPDEVAAGSVDGARAIPLGQLPERVAELPDGRPLVVYCGHGERASTAVSLLERAGRTRIVNVRGGFDAIEGSDAMK